MTCKLNMYLVLSTDKTSAPALLLPLLHDREDVRQRGGAGERGVQNRV
jgi:hypothetical protein